MKLEEVILRNTRALQPVATAVPIGTLYFVTDEGVIERSNGTTWDSYSSAGDATAATLLGRRSGSAGLVEEVTLASDLSLSTGAVLSTSAGILVATLTLTNAQILTLNSIPVEIIPAPGAGFVLMPLAWQYSNDFTAGALADPQVPNIRMTTWGTLFFDSSDWQPASQRFFMGTLNFSAQSSLSNFENKSIVVSADIDTTGGNAANSALMKLWYMKVPVL